MYMYMYHGKGALKWIQNILGTTKTLQKVKNFTVSYLLHIHVVNSQIIVHMKEVMELILCIH